MRAYPSSEATGDHGWLLTTEWRQILSPQMQWTAFVDHGEVRVNHHSYPGANGPWTVSLKGLGSSLSWTWAARGTVRLTWARRMGNNPLANAKTGLDGDGSLKRDRLWLSLTAFF